MSAPYICVPTSISRRAEFTVRFKNKSRYLLSRNKGKQDSSLTDRASRHTCIQTYLHLVRFWWPMHRTSLRKKDRQLCQLLLAPSFRTSYRSIIDADIYLPSVRALGCSSSIFVGSSVALIVDIFVLRVLLPGFMSAKLSRTFHKLRVSF